MAVDLSLLSKVYALTLRKLFIHIYFLCHQAVEFDEIESESQVLRIGNDCLCSVALQATGDFP